MKVAIQILVPVVLLLGAVGLAGIQDAVDTAPPPVPDHDPYCCCLGEGEDLTCFQKLCPKDTACSCPGGSVEIDCADMPPTVLDAEGKPVELDD